MLDLSKFFRTGSSPKEILRVKYSDIMAATKNKAYKAYKQSFDPIEPYLLSLFPKEDVENKERYITGPLSQIKVFIEEPKERLLYDVVDFQFEKGGCTVIGYELLNILTMPFDILPTLINTPNRVYNALVKFRLDHSQK